MASENVTSLTLHDDSSHLTNSLQMVKSIYEKIFGVTGACRGLWRQVTSNKPLEISTVY